MNHYHELSISLHKATDDEMRLAISLLKSELHRRMLMAPKEVVTDGDWIEWGGGDRPVLVGTFVDVRLRGGATVNRWEAENVVWRHSVGRSCVGDVVAYRVAP